jgi:hypothetical protein
MEIAGILVVILLWMIGFFILVAIIRYGVDTSKTSKKMDYLINEVLALKTELKKLKETKHIIDERI